MNVVEKFHRFKSRPLFFVLIFIVALLLLFEVLARFAFIIVDSAKAYRPLAVSNLKWYQSPDPKISGNWILKRGFSQTLSDAIASDLKRSPLGTSWIERASVGLPINRDEIIFQINSDGYKGPAIDKSHRLPRIVTIGDSCTFGSLIDHYSYPRTLERELKLMGRRVEVVNVGVEGYTPLNVLWRIEEFKALKPEVAIIYLGWNAIYSDSPKLGNFRIESVEFLEKLWGLIRKRFEDPKKIALELYRRKKIPDRNSKYVVELDNYVPTNYVRQMEKIILNMRSAGAIVFVTTLPGLFLAEQGPSKEALAKGHLPAYTDNPFFLAKLSDRYNAAIRNLVRHLNVNLIDLDKWSRISLRPREEFFDDSVHLTPLGQEKIGKYMTEEIWAKLSQVRGDK